MPPADRVASGGLPAPGAEVEAFVLAGGGSRRFGSDKALFRLDGGTLLERAVQLLRGMGFTPRVVAHRALEYRSCASAFVLGERPGRGPVEGLRAALNACGTPWALVLAVDMPGVTRPALEILLRRAWTEPGSIHCFEHRGRRHPLPGVYPRTRVLELLRERPELTAMQDLLGEAGSPGGWPGDPADGDAALGNLNRPKGPASPGPSR